MEKEIFIPVEPIEYLGQGEAVVRLNTGQTVEIFYEPDAKSQLRSEISAYCRWRINQGICEDGDCEFCPVNEAYDMARDEDDDPEF